VTDTERQQMIMDHYFVVKTLAVKYASKSPLSVEELSSIGSVGLTKAAQTYDASKGASFHTYAHRVVSGHMIDAIRVRLGSRIASFKPTKSFSSFEDPSSEGEGYAASLEDPSPSPSAQAEIKDLVPMLMGILTPREKQVIHAIYFQSMLQQDIADKFGITIQGVSMHHINALRKMRDKGMALDRDVPARVSVESIVDALMEEREDYLDFDLGNLIKSVKKKDKTERICGPKQGWSSAAVFFFPEGESVLAQLTTRWQRPEETYRDLLPEVFKRVGLPSDTKATWSQQAGCACGCSPGFLLGGVGDSFDIFVHVDYGLATKRD